MSVIPIESGIYSHSMFSETFKTCLREQENGISASHEFHFMIFFSVVSFTSWNKTLYKDAFIWANKYLVSRQYISRDASVFSSTMKTMNWIRCSASFFVRSFCNINVSMPPLFTENPQAFQSFLFFFFSCSCQILNRKQSEALDNLSSLWASNEPKCYFPSPVFFYATAFAMHEHERAYPLTETKKRHIARMAASNFIFYSLKYLNIFKYLRRRKTKSSMKLKNIRSQ